MGSSGGSSSTNICQPTRSSSHILTPSASKRCNVLFCSRPQGPKPRNPEHTHTPSRSGCPHPGKIYRLDRCRCEFPVPLPANDRSSSLATEQTCILTSQPEVSSFTVSDSLNSWSSPFKTTSHRCCQRKSQLILCYIYSRNCHASVELLFGKSWQPTRPSRMRCEQRLTDILR